eukprot:m.289602 g.289602  ORF g.289602 m.289602 type:complete len:581 (-) comp16374_c0_seq2:66-1808(-)
MRIVIMMIQKAMLVLLNVCVCLGVSVEQQVPISDYVEVAEHKGAQHPDAHIAGFHLKSVITHHVVLEKHSHNQGFENSPQQGAKLRHVLHRRNLQFDENPHVRNLDELRRRSRRADPLPSFSANSNSRDRVIALLKLNLLAYPGALTGEQQGISFSYDEETMKPMFEQNASLFGNNYTAEIDEAQRMHDAIKAEVEATPNTTSAFYYAPEETAEFKIGVAALIYEREGIETVIFRGSYTDGDFSNIQNWILPYILEKMTENMKSTWIDILNLPWDDTMQDRADTSTTVADTAIRAVTEFIPTSFKKDLNNAVKEGQKTDDGSNVRNVEMSESIAEQVGYWPITKAIADLYKDSTEESLLLSGHSQGGGRAALMSMYLQKQYGKSIHAVTYAGVGGACFPRELMSGASLTDDVDPYIAHPQITDYSHPLDPYGSALGRDVGNRCYYWKTPVTESYAYEWCEPIWGYPGSVLTFANSLSTDLGKEYKRCRYATHLIQTMNLELQPDMLNDDGSMKSGICYNAEAVDDDECPTNDTPLSFWLTVGGIILIVVIVLVGSLMALIVGCKLCYQGKLFGNMCGTKD